MTVRDWLTVAGSLVVGWTLLGAAALVVSRVVPAGSHAGLRALSVAIFCYLLGGGAWGTWGVLQVIRVVETRGTILPNLIHLSLGFILSAAFWPAWILMAIMTR